PDSQMPIFENIFADIGDFQSIEQDLSTFTSRMKRMQNILTQANYKSLVLVDEIGVGTDPDEGSALAVAFLEELTRRKSTTIVTTHHGALKEFAYNTPGAENGSMEFDVDTLQPAFKFRLGIPGSSYAIEIAKRLGIASHLLSRSRELIGNEKGQLERLILDLEKKVQESEKLTEQLNLEQIRLQGLTNLYSRRFATINNQEKSLKKKALEDAEEILLQANATVEKAIKEIREKQATHDAIAQAKKLIAEEKSRIAREMKKVVTEKPEKENLPRAKGQIGEEVFWKQQNAYGKIVAGLDGSGKVMIQVDNLKFKVPLKDIYAKKKPQPGSHHATSVKIHTTPKSDILPEIDLRGQSLDEAITHIDKFLDDALLAGWKQVRVIHGKGTGALRKGINDFLTKHPRVKHQKMGAWNEGDIGVTVVNLD
ncbi:MAG: Smr/MutS family protein, partial [bacterium]